MSVKVVVSFDVADTGKFRKSFNERDGARREAGLSAGFYVQIDAPNTVWIIGDAPSKEAFMAFFFVPGAKRTHAERWSDFASNRHAA